MYQTMDEGFVGLIYSVFNQVLLQHIAAVVTSFVRDLKMRTMITGGQ